MSFTEGDRVFALFEGTRLWYPAKVVSGPDASHHYEVEFSNGTVNTTREADIKRESTFRTSSKSPGRKSPARSRSRSRSRGRSPARTGRSPGRPRSPARTQRPRSKSPEARQSPKKEAVIEKKEVKGSSPTRVSSRRTRSEKLDPVVVIKSNHTEPPTRQSARIAAQQNEIPVAEKVEPVVDDPKRHVAKTRPEVRSVLVLLVIVISLASLPLILRHCTKTDCVFIKLTPLPKSVAVCFDRQVALAFVCWILLQAVLAVLPIGCLVEGQTLRTGSRLKYRCNGLFSLFITCALWLVAAFYFKYPVVLVADKFFHLTVAATLFSLLFSLGLYVRARRQTNGALNPNGNSGNFLYDFYFGHEFNPRFGTLDVKLFVLRAGHLALAVYNAALLAKYCTTQHAAPSHTLLLITALQAWYSLDALWYEETLLTEWTINKDGVGFLFVFSNLALMPVLFSIPSRYILQYGVDINNWLLFAIFLFHASGYIIRRASISQKHQFRRNPFNPSLSHLESIPTNTGKRLLVSGWWGLCRHPNYLGELIIGVSWCLLCGFTHVFPHLYVVYLVVVLIARSRRDDRYCKKAYGAAWTNYSNRVKYRIVPYVY